MKVTEKEFEIFFEEQASILMKNKSKDELIEFISNSKKHYKLLDKEDLIYLNQAEEELSSRL